MFNVLNSNDNLITRNCHHFQALLEMNQRQFDAGTLNGFPVFLCPDRFSFQMPCADESCCYGKDGSGGVSLLLSSAHSSLPY